MSIKTLKVKNVASEILSMDENEKLSKNGSKLFNSANVKKDIKTAKDLLHFIHQLENDPLKEFSVLKKSARCHKLTTGIYKGYYSVRINKQLRICFKWGTEHGLDSNVYDLEINKHYGD